MTIDKFGLTLEQTEILYNLEMYKTVNDMERGGKKSELKCQWLEEWKQYMESSFSSFVGDENAVLHWYSVQELHDVICNNSPEKPWFRLVLLEAMLFEPYYPLSTEINKKGNEVPSTRYKELHLPFVGYSKSDGDNRNSQIASISSRKSINPILSTPLSSYQRFLISFLIITFGKLSPVSESGFNSCAAFSSSGSANAD